MSEGALGANYLVVRDRTADGPAPPYRFSDNLWVLATEPEVHGHEVHFPGQLGVNLEVSVLSPAAPQSPPITGRGPAPWA